jgi:hypothetical protein
MSSRSTLAVVALAAAVGLAACGDPLRVEAQLENTTDAFAVFALSGTPASYPTALNLSARQIVIPTIAANGTANFDLAFDLDAGGRVLVYPARLIARTFQAPPAVGLRRATESFDQLTRAPNTGYVTDSVVAVTPGQTVALQFTTGTCLYDPLYGKLVVDSVRPAARTIFVRLRVNPNCGFRALTTGRPED